MSVLSKTNKYSLYFFLSFFFTLLHTNLQAAECPTLTKKTLDLCNPTREEVAEGLVAPIAIIDGVRAVGSPDPSNDEFFSSIKGQEYTFKWIFKDGKGNEIASGCEQTFELNDKEAPTCGAATLKVHGKGLGSLGYAKGEVLISEFKNQQPTWNDNCTLQDDIVMEYISGINSNSNYNNNSSQKVQYSLTDKYNNRHVCEQTIKVSIDNNYECPNIKTLSLEIPNNRCDLTCKELITGVQNGYSTPPVMDGFGDDISPKKTNGNVNIYFNDKGSTDCIQSNFTPGEYKVYFNYSRLLTNKYCAVPIIVKENSNPPSCPELTDIIIDKPTATAEEIKASVKSKVNQYGPQLDNCLPNADLDVIYSGENLTAPYCGTISYLLSDYGTMRSCKAKVVLPQCPELEALTIKYCQTKPSIDEVALYIEGYTPKMNICSQLIEATYNQSELNHSYSSGKNIAINWIFTFNSNGISKQCKQTINIERDNNVSCSATDIILEAENNCIVKGSSIPLATIHNCNAYYTPPLQWRDNKSNSWDRNNISSLSSRDFKDGDVIYWHVGDATCTTHISVVDNTKPTCTNPSLEKLTGKCSFTRSEVETKMPTTDKLGTDNCGIKSAAIDWDQTAFETFTSNSDGSPKTYDIYYTITDNSDLTNDGFCIATIEVEGIPAPNCPDTEIYALSSDGTAQISLSKDAEWSIKSPSSVSFNAGKITGLSLDKTNNVEFEAKWCDSFKKVCPTTIKLIKAVKPCNE